MTLNPSSSSINCPSWSHSGETSEIIVLFLNNLTLSTFRHPILQARKGKNNYEKHYNRKPRSQPAQKTEVRLNRGRSQLFPLPDVDHCADVPVAEIARIGQGFETGFLFQVTEKPPQEKGAFLAGFERDGFFKGGMPGIKMVIEPATIDSATKY